MCVIQKKSTILYNNLSNSGEQKYWELRNLMNKKTKLAMEKYLKWYREIGNMVW